jgi:hypothetical protein
MSSKRYGWGDFVYEEVAGWGEFPDCVVAINVPETFVDANDRVYILLRDKAPILSSIRRPFA